MSIFPHILAEEIKASKISKISEAKKSKDNSYEASNSGNIKINILSSRKGNSRVIPILALIKFVRKVNLLRTGWSLRN